MFQQKNFQNYSQQLHFQKLEHCLIDLEGEIKFSTNHSKAGQKKYKLIKCMELFKQLHQFYSQANVKYLFDFTLKLVDNITFLFNQFMTPQKQLPNKKIHCSVQTDKSSINEKQGSKRLLGRFGGIILNNQYCHHCKMAIDRGSNYNDEDDTIYKKQLEDELRFQNELKHLLCKEQRSKVASSGIEFKIQQIIQTMNISFSEVQIFLDHFIKRQKQESQNASWMPNFIKKLLNKYLLKTFEVVRKISTYEEKAENQKKLTLASQIIKHQITYVTKKINLGFPIERKVKKLITNNQRQTQTIVPYPDVNLFKQEKLTLRSKAKPKLDYTRLIQITVLSQKYLTPDQQQYILDEENGHKIEYAELKKHHKKYKQILDQNQNYKNKLQVYEQKIKSYENVNRYVEEYTESIKQNQIKTMNLSQDQLEKLFAWLDHIVQCLHNELNIQSNQSISNKKQLSKDLDLKNKEEKKRSKEKIRSSEGNYYKTTQKNQILPKSMTSHQKQSHNTMNKKDTNKRISQSRVVQKNDNFNSTTPTNEITSKQVTQFFQTNINRNSHSNSKYKQISQIKYLNKNNINLQKLTKNIFKKENQSTIIKSKESLKQDSFYFKTKKIKNQDNQKPLEEKKSLYNFILSILQNGDEHLDLKNKNKSNLNQNKHTLINCKSLDQTNFRNIQQQNQKDKFFIFPRRINKQSVSNQITVENQKVPMSQPQSIVSNKHNYEHHNTELNKIIEQIHEADSKIQVPEMGTEFKTRTDELKSNIKLIIQAKIRNHKNCVKDPTQICIHLKKYYQVLRLLSQYKGKKQVFKMNLHSFDKIQQFQNK